MFFSDGGVDGRRGAERRAEPQGGVDGGAGSDACGSDDAGGGADRRGDVGPRRGRRTGVAATGRRRRRRRRSGAGGPARTAPRVSRTGRRCATQISNKENHFKN